MTKSEVQQGPLLLHPVYRDAVPSCQRVRRLSRSFEAWSRTSAALSLELGVEYEEKTVVYSVGKLRYRGALWTQWSERNGRIHFELNVNLPDDGFMDQRSASVFATRRTVTRFQMLLHRSEYESAFTPIVEWAESFLGYPLIFDAVLFYDVDTERIDIRAFDREARRAVIVGFEPGFPEEDSDEAEQ